MAVQSRKKKRRVVHFGEMAYRSPTREGEGTTRRAQVTGTWERKMMARIGSRKPRTRFCEILTVVPFTSTARMTKLYLTTGE